MRTKRVSSSLIFGALIVIIGLAITAAAQNKQPQANTAESSLLAVLEKSGYSYSKVTDGVYEIPATGKNLKEFALRVTQADDLVVLIAKIADRKNVIIKEPLLVKLLEMNDSFDTVKIALSAEMLYLRIDMHSRIADAEELKYMVEQMARAMDEAYPHMKPFLTGK